MVVVEKETYSAVCFGDHRNSTGTIATDKRFTGQRLDGTGLYYYGGRYYDPEIGRFISADTFVQYSASIGTVSAALTVNAIPTCLGSAATKDYCPPSTAKATVNPQLLNRYSYVLNNPLKYTDPSGYVNWAAVACGVAMVAIAVGICVIAAPAVAAAIGAATGIAVLEVTLDISLIAFGPTLLGGMGLLLTAWGFADPNSESADAQSPQFTASVSQLDYVASQSGYYSTEYQQAIDYAYYSVASSLQPGQMVAWSAESGYYAIDIDSADWSDYYY